MQRVLAILAIVSVTFFSCRESKVIKPESILSQSVMIELFLAMHIADAHINLATTPRDSARLVLTKEYQSIFAKYNIDQKEFNESYQWYAEHSKELDAIYEEIIVRLQEKRDSLK